MLECRLEGRATDQCALILLSDWMAVRRYYLALEQEIRAACLGLGWTPAQCETE